MVMLTKFVNNTFVGHIIKLTILKILVFIKINIFTSTCTFVIRMFPGYAHTAPLILQLRQLTEKFVTFKSQITVSTNLFYQKIKTTYLKIFAWYLGQKHLVRSSENFKDFLQKQYCFCKKSLKFSDDLTKCFRPDYRAKIFVQDLFLIGK